jgi:hypothetical protein
MSDGPDHSGNSPIDDELDAAVMIAAELVSRVKRVGMTRLEVPIKDEFDTWIVTVRKRETAAYGGSNGEPGNHGRHGVNSA